MKILFIGGTGIISSACAELAARRGHELVILNRSISTKYSIPEGVQHIIGDIHAPTEQLFQLLAGYRFDAIASHFTSDNPGRGTPGLRMPFSVSEHHNPL